LGGVNTGASSVDEVPQTGSRAWLLEGDSEERRKSFDDTQLAAIVTLRATPAFGLQIRYRARDACVRVLQFQTVHRFEMALTIRRENPLKYADSLKSLMLAHEHKAFDAFFDRGYADVVDRGGASWLGFDASGCVQMNVTLFRHDFEYNGRTLAAGMLGNMMAAKEYRTFFPMIALIKQLIRDVQADGKLDFLYTDPNPGATAIVKGTKLEHAGNMDRYVIPLGDESLTRHIAARAYSTSLRLRVAGQVAHIVEHGSECFDPSAFLVPPGESGRVRPHHTPALYLRRLGGYPGPEYRWFSFFLGRNRSEPDAAILLHGPDENGLAIIYAVRRKPGTPVAPLIPPLIGALRRQRTRRLQIETVRDSEFARELEAIGFKYRNDFVPVYVLPISPAGSEAVQNIAQWEITGLDMER